MYYLVQFDNFFSSLNTVYIPCISVLFVPMFFLFQSKSKTKEEGTLFLFVLHASAAVGFDITDY